MAAAITTAQWENLNPGHGGQIQHVSCDPNHAGWFYLASDMEGFYVSFDYGESWLYKGWETPDGDILQVQAEPGDSNRLYLGHRRGFALSDDFGRSWQQITSIPSEPMGTMAIDPHAPHSIYLAAGWLEEEDVAGPRRVYCSHDRGATWLTSDYQGGVGNRHCFQIAINPTESSEVVLATQTGMYRSSSRGTTWSPVPPPVGATSECRGAAFTPDGDWLYALYVREDGKTGVYVAAEGDGAWMELDPAGAHTRSSTTHHMPKVWEVSTTSEHWLLFGQLPTPNDGLYEGHFTVDDDAVSGTVTQILGFQGREDVSFDIGWNAYNAMCRTNVYYPASWYESAVPPTEQRGVFTAVQQQAFRGDAAGDPNNDSWTVVTCALHETRDGIGFYRTRGTASTWDWEVAGVGSYVVQGQGDNGIVESFDGGRSWTQELRPPGRWPASWPNGEAFGIVPGEPPLLVATVGPGFGGGNWNDPNSEIWYKFLTTTTHPVDPWQVLVTPTERHGLPASRYYSVSPDPNVAGRLYLGSILAGPYLCEDITALIAGVTSSGFRFIGAGGPGTSPVRRIAVDPGDSDTLFVMAMNGTWRGQRSTDGQYQWQLVFPEGESSQGDGGMFVWRHNDQTRVLISTGSADHVLRLSTDLGQSWQPLLTEADAVTLLPPASWYSSDLATLFGGVTAHEEELFCDVHVRRERRKVLGFLRGHLHPDGSVSWSDWTFAFSGDLQRMTPRRGSRFARVWPDETGRDYLWVATNGSGLWRRPIDDRGAESSRVISSRK